MDKTNTATEKSGNSKQGSAKSSTTSKKRMITIADTPEDVLRYDSEKYVLTFDSKKGNFLALPDEIVQQLSGFNAVAYGISLGMNQRDADNTEGRPVMEIFQPSHPRDRLRVEGKRSGMGYYWARPDKLWEHERRAGYKPVDAEGTRSLSGHRIKKLGETELVLMEAPQEFIDKAKQKKREDSERRKSRMDLAERAALSKGGARYYDEDEDPHDKKRPWGGPKLP